MDKVKELKKLRDKVANAGARVARAQLHLEIAEADLAAAKKAVAVLLATPEPRFDVRLTSAGSNKIAVIKAIREITNLGLREAKEITDFADWETDPRALIVKNVDFQTAFKVDARIVLAGGLTKAVQVYA